MYYCNIKESLGRHVLVRDLISLCQAIYIRPVLFVAWLLLLLRASKPAPVRPKPISNMEAGSGTGEAENDAEYVMPVRVSPLFNRARISGSVPPMTVCVEKTPRVNEEPFAADPV